MTHPQRYTPTFGSLGYVRSNERSDDISYEESVGAIGELIKAGKIRHWGISNENAVGVLKFIEAAKKLGVAPPVSIQNDFSMVDRRFEQDGTAEACSPHSSQIENGVGESSSLLYCLPRVPRVGRLLLTKTRLGRGGEAWERSVRTTTPNAEGPVAAC